MKSTSTQEVQLIKAQESCKRWLFSEHTDERTKTELKRIQDDKEEVYDRYYKDLEFGTGGLRGVLGAGTNRINIYTVRRASQGFADYINGIIEEECTGSVAISYDSRNMSCDLAQSAAEVFVANGIKVHIFTELMPTPALSFAVRYYGCQAGVMITASHNPAKYNGYKAYDANGCQLTDNAANAVISCINKLDIFDDVKYVPFSEALGNGIEYIPAEVHKAYLEAVKQQSMTKGQTNGGLSVVYTPLNGAGNKPVREILKMIGIDNVTVVKEQELPDGNFPTCPYPNPEKAEALTLGLDLCKSMAKKGDTPDLLLATDPDCDRVGIAVYHKGSYLLLTGNEVGILLLDFICRMRVKNKTMPKRPIAIKTIVSSTMADDVAGEYGVSVINVLTGFKYIGEQIKFLEDNQEENRFIFGFEESYGYLSSGFVRDKDAVNASMLICEMAAACKQEGKTLVDAMQELYKKHGYYKNHLLDFYFEGAQGMAKMAALMKGFRDNPPEKAAGRKVVKSVDYMIFEKTGFPPSDVLEYILEDGSSFVIRPSGTEPKIKIYFSAKGKTRDESDEIISLLQDEYERNINDK